MSHYHHRQAALLPSSEPPLNLAPGRGLYPGYPPAIRYPGHQPQPIDRFQSRAAASYPLPWSYHPQYGDVQYHQQVLPPTSLPPPNPNHHRQQHLGFRHHHHPQAQHQHQQQPYQQHPLPLPHSSVAPPKHPYPMPSSAVASPVHVEVANGRTGSSHDGSVNSVSPDPETIKDHCDSIIQHPLFPLLRLLLEKLEDATLTAVTPSPEEINSELENLVRLIQQSSASVATGRPDIDDVMLQAVTVLRLHLFELEKVNELCRDFCDRYTACLRKNLHTDQILRSDSFDLDEDEALAGLASGGGGLSRSNSAVDEGNHGGGRSNVNFPLPVSLASHQQQTPSSPMYDLVPAHQHTFTGQSHSHMDLSGQGHPLKQREGYADDSGMMGREVLSPSSVGESMYDEGDKYDADQEDTCSPSTPGGGKINRRGILPKDAINTMKTWLFQHIMHPYPTEDEKRILSSQTRLSLLQVNNWFINARRRILQPMLDASNPGGHRPKKGMQSRPVDPFWTGSGPPVTAGTVTGEDHNNANATDIPSMAYTHDHHHHLEQTEAHSDVDSDVHLLPHDSVRSGQD